VNRRDVLALLSGTALTSPRLAPAQELPRIPRIGVMMGSSPAIEAERFGAFRVALERLGYVEGRTILIEPRYGESQPDRFSIIAREMVERRPTVIVCVGSQEAAALQAATRTIPIVFTQAGSPVELGLVASFARPGGNITGFTQMSGELDSKRLELLHEIAPSVSRVIVLLGWIEPRLMPVVQKRFADVEATAKVLGIALQRVDAATPAELSAALASAAASSTEALLVQNDPLFATERPRIIDFALTHRLPTVFGQKLAVAQGGLVGYGPDLIENARLAAGYVDKILKGAKPGELPVQQPTKFELVINLKTAKALGITIPHSLLQRADEVIE